MSEFWSHPSALCESESVGAGTRLWAFCHVLPHARIGRDCNIGDGAFVENDVVLGDRVTVKNGVHLWDGIRIGDDVVIGPNATFADARFVRADEPRSSATTVVEDGSVLGANCTIMSGVRIGRRAVVRAGAVVARDVPANAIVTGDPARIVGYVDASEIGIAPTVDDATVPVDASAVRGVTIHRMRLIHDMRGDLSVGEFDRDIPFDVARYFIVFNVPSADVRGEHAHRECKQFLLCVKGSCSVVVDDGRNRAEFELHEPNVGLLLPPMIWATQYKFSPETVLLVFASHHYDPDDYIRDFDQFLREIGVAPPGAPPA